MLSEETKRDMEFVERRNEQRMKMDEVHKLVEDTLTSHAENIIRSGLPVLRSEHTNCDITLLVSDRLYKKLQEIGHE